MDKMSWWAIILLVVIIGVGVWVSNQKTEPSLVGGQTDEHGCLVGAGYSWSEEKQACVRPWEEEAKVEAAGALQKILADKYDKSPNAVEVTIEKVDGHYVSGAVRFDGGGVGNAGGVLAYKEGDNWVLVYDGNGSVDCSKLKTDYAFPSLILSPNYCD